MRRVVLSIVVTAAIASAAAGATTEYASASGVFPNQICPAWDRFANSSVNAALAAGKLVLQTSWAWQNLGYMQHAPVIDFSSKTRTIEARLRYVSGSSQAINRTPAAISVTTAPNLGNLFFIDRDRIFLLNSGDGVGPSAFVDTDDAFHTYRLEIEPAGTIRVYYDGALQFTGSTWSSASNYGPTPRVLFGEVSSYATGRSEWEFVRHDALAEGAADCLTSWWRAEANALDSVRAHHGTLVGNTTFDQGVCEGQAFQFDGFGDGVSVSDAADLGSMANLSFDAWVRFRTIQTGRLQVVMAKGLVAGAGTSSYALWLNAAGTMSAAVESATQLNTASGTDRISAGRLYHMAVTYDGAQIRLYINGALQGSAALTGPVRDTSNSVFLGRRDGAGTDGGGDSIDGTVDEARIWSRALSEAEVRAAYDAGCVDDAPPVAVAGADQTIECAGAATTVTLDGSASSDPDDDIASYEWFEGTMLVATGAIAEARLGAVGDHMITLRVTDASGLSSEDSLTVMVADTAPPDVSAPAGVSAATGAGATSCAAFIPDTILGKASASDVCFGDADVERSGVPAGNLFPVGTTTITYTARDAAGNEATADQLVTVIDDTPASISNVTVSQARLWPANHKMVDVFVGYDATDGCGAAATSLSVASSDAAGARGDVTSPDWVIVDEHHVQLRAERAPNARERIYTITITARDVYGNESSRSVTVSVSP